MKTVQGVLNVTHFIFIIQTKIKQKTRKSPFVQVKTSTSTEPKASCTVSQISTFPMQHFK